MPPEPYAANQAPTSRGRVGVRCWPPDTLREQLGRAQDELRAVQQASTAKDASRVESALIRLHEAWSPLQAAAARPPN